jgi:hypothetical protein
MSKRLDTLRRRFYIARPLLVAVGALLLAPLAVADVVMGIQLPMGIQKVGENRYRVPDTFDGTVKYFRSVYPPDRFPRRPIVNQPGVKAMHIELPGKKVAGLNIYEANDEVRIYLVPR